MMNRVQMALKNFEYRTLVKPLPALFALDCVKTLNFFLGRSVDSPSALATAHLWILRNLDRIWQKRLQVSQLLC
jgi:hypothetical protein